MKVTVTSIQKYIQQHGLEPVQIDEIPEGLSFIEPDITIGQNTIHGEYIAFIPFSSWEDMPYVSSENKKHLLELYKEQTKKHAI